jgi:transposase
MIPVPMGTQIWVACGATDMRRGFDGLAMMVQEVIKKDPYSGHLFAFRGKRADRIKILWWDGTGLCLYSTTCIHTTPPSASVEDFSTIAATRSTRRFHRLHCLRGGFDAGISYR